MSASSFFGALGDFARDRNEKIAVEQEKQDRLTEQLRKVQIQGVKAQQDKYDKQKSYYDHIDSLIGDGSNRSGILAAMGVASEAELGVLSAKAIKEFTGADVEMELDEAGYKSQYKNMRSQINEFRKNSRPELTPESIEKIHARRGVDNLGFERSIRNLLGIESKAYYGTPQEGLKTLRGDVSAGVKYKKKVKDKKGLKWEQRIITDAQTGKVRQITFAVNEDGTLISGDSKLLKKPWKKEKDGSATQDKETKVSAEETRTLDAIARGVVQEKWSQQGENTEVLMEMFGEVMDPTTNRPRAGAISRGQQVLYSIYEGLKAESPSSNTGEIAALSVKAMEILNDVGAFTKKPVAGTRVLPEWMGGRDDEYLDIAPTVTLWGKNPETNRWQEKRGIPLHRVGIATKMGFTSFNKLPQTIQQKITARRGVR